MPTVTPDDKGIRPAGKSDECFYCQSKIGAEHGPECEMVRKLVTVRYSYVIQIEVPSHWTKENVEFFRNESSSCANNSLAEIESHIQRTNSCLCGEFTCEVLDQTE